jgi:hypothetical protein
MAIPREANRLKRLIVLRIEGPEGDHMRPTIIEYAFSDAARQVLEDAGYTRSAKKPRGGKLFQWTNKELAERPPRPRWQVVAELRQIRSTLKKQMSGEEDR